MQYSKILIKSLIFSVFFVGAPLWAMEGLPGPAAPEGRGVGAAPASFSGWIVRRLPRVIVSEALRSQDRADGRVRTFLNWSRFLLNPVVIEAFLHESGHEVVRKLVTGKPFTLHIGAQLEDVPAAEWSVPGIHIHDRTDGSFAAPFRHEEILAPNSLLMDRQAAASENWNALPTEVARKIRVIKGLYYVVGPVMSLLFYGGIIKGLGKLQAMTGNRSDSFKVRMFNGICSILLKPVATGLLTESFVYGLTPFNTMSNDDGQRLWRIMGLSTAQLARARVLSPVSEYTPLIVVLLSIYKNCIEFLKHPDARIKLSI